MLLVTYGLFIYVDMFFLLVLWFLSLSGVPFAETQTVSLLGSRGGSLGCFFFFIMLRTVFERPPGPFSFYDFSIGFFNVSHPLFYRVTSSITYFFGLGTAVFDSGPGLGRLNLFLFIYLSLPTCGLKFSKNVYISSF